MIKLSKHITAQYLLAGLFMGSASAFPLPYAVHCKDLETKERVNISTTLTLNLEGPNTGSIAIEFSPELWSTIFRVLNWNFTISRQNDTSPFAVDLSPIVTNNVIGSTEDEYFVQFDGRLKTSSDRKVKLPFELEIDTLLYSDVGKDEPEISPISCFGVPLPPERKDAVDAIFKSFGNYIPGHRVNSVNPEHSLRVLPPDQFFELMTNETGETKATNENTFGFTYGPEGAKIAAIRDDGPPYTETHELIHLYQNPSFKKYMGRVLLEGVAHLFTKTVFLNHTYHEPYDFSAEYETQVNFASNHLIGVVGIEMVKEAFFGEGDEEIIRLRDVYEAKRGVGSFEVLQKASNR